MTIIFDLDGTLLDTLDDLTAAVNHALRTIGRPERQREEVLRFVGNGIRALVQRSLTDAVGQADADRAMTAFTAYYMAHCTDLTRPYPGIPALLHALNDEGHNLAIVSNKVDAAVKALGRQYFGQLIPVAIGEGAPLSLAEGGIVRAKPCPDTLLAVMQQFGATPADTLYVGDSEVDIQTARNAGVPCLSVTWGFRDIPTLTAAGATTLISTPEEILERIREYYNQF